MKKRYVLKSKGRFIALLTTVLLLIFTFVFAASAYGYKEPIYEVITIRSGDTLWDIAGEHKKDGDIRSYIYEIKKINKMADGSIYEGDVLKIPE